MIKGAAVRLYISTTVSTNHLFLSLSSYGYHFKFDWDTRGVRPLLGQSPEDPITMPSFRAMAQGLRCKIKISVTVTEEQMREAAAPALSVLCEAVMNTTTILTGVSEISRSKNMFKRQSKAQPCLCEMQFLEVGLPNHTSALCFLAHAPFLARNAHLRSARPSHSRFAFSSPT